MSTANVAIWQKKDGDQVDAGELLVTLETDKVSEDLEAEASGVVEILVAEGEEVPIGTVIAKITVGKAAPQGGSYA